MSTRGSPHQPTFPAGRSRPKGVRRRAAAYLGVVAIAACSPDRATAPAAGARALDAGPRDVTPSTTEQLLYQQPPIVGPAQTISAPVGLELASDFTVPAGGRWHVTRIVVLGQEYNQALTVSVYPDNGGRPGTSIVASATPTLSTSTATVDPCCGTSIFDYDVPMTFTVDPGRYWVSERGPFFAERSPTTGLPMLIGTFSPSLWLSVPGLGDNGDIAFFIYGTVETVAEALTGLQTTLDGLGLDFGTLTSFQAKLTAATAALDAGDEAGACQSLQDLINAVSALSSKKLTAAEASALITEVRRIRELIGC